MPTNKITFASLNLAQPLMRAIADAGYTSPTRCRRRRSRWYWPAEICLPGRKPEPARPLALRCRSCICSPRNLSQIRIPAARAV